MKIDSLFICSGNTDSNFVNMVAAKKGKIASPDGKVAAFVDNTIVQVGDQVYTSTVRAGGCELLSSSTKCPSCKKYRGNLRAMYSRWLKQPNYDGSNTSSHRYLNVPQAKAKLDAMHNRMHFAEETIKKLREK